jgi:small subunit ribosomal protein S12
MPTTLQLYYRERTTRKRNVRNHQLRGCPQKKAHCLRFTTHTPKKPNSARRRVAKVLIISTKKKIFCYIPGMGSHSLQRHSEVLLRGGRRRDLPGIRYSAIRGVLSFDTPRGRRKARSKYGIKKWF